MTNKSYFETNDKSLCCGCRACEQACNKNAITMTCDDEGFIYPQINKELCVGCNICRKICPVSCNNEEKHIGKIYQMQNKNEELLKRSSSGGVFIDLARYVLSADGIVFGTVLDEHYQAVIVSACSEKELEAMQGSKYVFSNTQTSYQETENYLKNNKLVLYTGSPCQIAGLKSFLKKDYENLITMDFLCHGMPSPSIFNENIKFLEKKYRGTISGYKFRDKSLKGWGLVTSFYAAGKKHYESGKLNAYFYGFIKGYLNRYSCYSCQFRGEHRASDITVGDFWGCDDECLNIRNGVSFIAVNTHKGESVFQKIKDNFLFKETTATAVAKMNSSLLYSSDEKIPEIRRVIYKDLKSDGYKTVAKKYLTTDKRFLLKSKMKLDLILQKISIRK